MDIVLVHGYNVRSTKTYGALPRRLKALGYRVANVYLSKYVTLDNALSIGDIIKGFQAALVDVYGAKLEEKKFAVITHSTGGLVVRGWIETYYGRRLNDLPVSHLLMLAPPTHGSRLAKLGKSRLSRLRGFWGEEAGIKVLDSLELGSDYQWDLNTRWMKKRLHSRPGFYSAVIIGQWIDKKLWDVIVPATRERGSDGVVRVSAANLNMQKVTVRPQSSQKKERLRGVPFLVPPLTSHSDTPFGVMGSIPRKGRHPVASAIETFLNVKSKKEFAQFEADMAVRTAKVQRRDQYFDRSKLHRYAQLVFRVRDTMGNNLPDYAIEFFDPRKPEEMMDADFIHHKHKNAMSPHAFVFYVNADKMIHRLGETVGVRVESESDSPMVRLNRNEFVMEGAVEPNQTTMIEVVLRRRLNKNVFRLTKNLDKQKIRRAPGRDWIE